MDTTRLLEKYEANHAIDSCTADLERFYAELVEKQINSTFDAYSPKWADQQRTFLAMCRTIYV